MRDRQQELLGPIEDAMSKAAYAGDVPEEGETSICWTRAKASWLSPVKCIDPAKKPFNEPHPQTHLALWS